MSLTSLLGLITTNPTAITSTASTTATHTHGALYGPGSWQTANMQPNALNQVNAINQIGYPQSPYTNIELVNVLECKNNDDATEKLGAFRKIIPPDQDLMLFGKWIFVIKMPAIYPGMAIQIVLPPQQVNAP